MAKLCGLPGKLGMDGSQVWPAWQRGEIAAIRAYCETDVVNTYLLYLRFMRLRGALQADAYREEVAFVRKRLGELNEVPWAGIWDDERAFRAGPCGRDSGEDVMKGERVAHGDISATSRQCDALQLGSVT